MSEQAAQDDTVQRLTNLWVWTVVRAEEAEERQAQLESQLAARDAEIARLKADSAAEIAALKELADGFAEEVVALEAQAARGARADRYEAALKEIADPESTAGSSTQPHAVSWLRRLARDALTTPDAGKEEQCTCGHAKSKHKEAWPGLACTLCRCSSFKPSSAAPASGTSR